MTIRHRLQAFRERVRGLGDGVLARVATSVDASLARSRVRSYGAVATFAPTTALLPEARIENLQHDRSAIRIGGHTAVRAELLVLGHGGQIDVGEWCYLGVFTRIWSASRVSIGNRVLIAHACEIHDWNAHPLDSAQRHEHFRRILTSGHPTDLPDVPSLPIRIEDDVWLGFRTTVLKGVTIGQGAVVAACSLVTEDVPPGVLVAGSPARVVRALPEWADAR